MIDIGLVSTMSQCVCVCVCVCVHVSGNLYHNVCPRTITQLLGVWVDKKWGLRAEQTEHNNI